MSLSFADALDSVINSCRKIARSVLYSHQRLDFLENLLREREIHSADCAVVIIQELNSQGMAYYHPKPCDCWLADPKTPYKE